MSECKTKGKEEYIIESNDKKSHWLKKEEEIIGKTL